VEMICLWRFARP